MPRHYTRCGSTATSPRGTCTISPRLWGLSSMPPRSPRSMRPRGKSGRALTAWLARDAARDPESPSSWHRIPVGRGVELHVETAHPLARLGPEDAAVAEAVRQALAKLLPSANA